MEDASDLNRLGGDQLIQGCDQGYALRQPGSVLGGQKFTVLIHRRLQSVADLQQLLIDRLDWFSYGRRAPSKSLTMLRLRTSRYACAYTWAVACADLGLVASAVKTRVSASSTGEADEVPGSMSIAARRAEASLDTSRELATCCSVTMLRSVNDSGDSVGMKRADSTITSAEDV